MRQKENSWWPCEESEKRKKLGTCTELQETSLAKNLTSIKQPILNGQRKLWMVNCEDDSNIKKIHLH